MFCAYSVHTLDSRERLLYVLIGTDKSVGMGNLGKSTNGSDLLIPGRNYRRRIHGGVGCTGEGR